MKIRVKGCLFLIDEEDLKRIIVWTWWVLLGPNTYYVVGCCNGRRMLMHNLIVGKHPTLDVDHIDRNGWNNQKSNLRFVTRSANNLNSVVLPRHNTSGVKGVCWYPNYQKWRAFIKINGKQITLGYFKDFEQACLTRVSKLNQITK